MWVRACRTDWTICVAFFVFFPQFLFLCFFLTDAVCAQQKMFASYESELAEAKKALKGYIQSIPSAKGGESPTRSHKQQAQRHNFQCSRFLSPFPRTSTDDRAQQIDAAHEALEQAQDLLEKMSYDDAMEDKVEGYKREVASIESMLKFVFSPLSPSTLPFTVLFCACTTGKWC